MPFVHYYEPIEQIDFTASTLKPRDLPAGVYRGLLLRLVLSCTNGGAADQTALDLANVIQSMAVKVNGQDTMTSVPGFHLYYMNLYDFSVAPVASIDTAMGAGAENTIDLYLPFSLTRAASPADGIFDARRPAVTNVTLQVLFSSDALGSDSVIDSGYIQIIGSMYDKVEPNFPKVRHEFTHLQADLAATGAVDVKLEYGGYNEFRRIFIYTFDNAGALSNVQIDNVALKSLSYSWADIPSIMLQNINGKFFSVAPQTGVHILDLTTDGRMSERLIARNLSELKLRLTSLVTTGTVQIVSEKVIGA